MNNNKQVIRFFLLALFITIICLSTNAFAAEEIGSISNPASLKVGGGIHKYSFKKSENGKIVTSQLGLSLEEVLSGDAAEKINQSINYFANENVARTSVLYIPEAVRKNLYVFKFKLHFYSSDIPTKIKGIELFSQNGFYTQDHIPITAYEHIMFNYSDKNEATKKLSPGNDTKTSTATVYYAAYLDNYKSGQYPIIELKNMGLLRYTSFVNTDPEYSPDQAVEPNPDAKYNIANATISGLKSKIYNGSALTQSLTLKYGSTVLKNNVDYNLYYTHNINPGAGIVYIVGKGNYYGHKLASFIISPPAPSKVYASISTNIIKLQWTKVYNSNGYYVQMYHPVKKKWITKDSISDPYCNLSDIKTDYDNKPLKSAAGYVIRITPYKKYYNSMKVDFSRSQYAYKQFLVYTLPAAVNITKLTSPAKRTISVTYGKSQRATGYLVQVYNSNKKLVKKVVTKGNYVKFSGLSSKQKYIVKVTPYKTFITKYNNKPLYCPNPKYKTITVK